MGIIENTTIEELYNTFEKLCMRVSEINNKLDKLLDEKKPKDRSEVEKDTKEALSFNDKDNVLEFCTCKEVRCNCGKPKFS